MDQIDKKILSILLEDGRISMTDLADRVGLSLSPCHRRVRLLEESKIICGYHAELDGSRLGLSFSAIVFVTLKTGDGTSIEKFEGAVRELGSVVAAHRLFGEPDYMLQVLTKDMPAFQRVYDDQLSVLPSVLRLSSTLVMKTVVQSRTGSGPRKIS
jgi:DNA-binding Lrp family transcriptional regulator